ncbi:radical SAM/SPASM domain-containing protein [Methanothrix harundinacea]|uniref:Radical SAM domain protein n=1 Tax=Methanothrix harundinacea (strain 6Ac) TaxID=1110509 RepID=G7WLS7_METH6|nr:radical SAM protein [Methanothrix harundinacea]AET63670.1 Radical SAM domain protein [Methanothrix harundinacea 6Ac]
MRERSREGAEGEEAGRYTLARSPLLRVEASVEEGRVRLRGEGPLSRLPFVRSALGIADGQIPVSAGERLILSTWSPPIPSRPFDRLVRSYVKASFGVRTPDQVTISITEECPNRCLHCALPDSGRHHRLEVEEVEDVVSQVLDLGTTLVIFDGGEPTTYRELPDLVRAVDERAVSTIFTSGAGFTERLARNLKDAGLYAVNVSLDSAAEAEHDRMRGRAGAFRDAMRAVEEALAAGLLVDLYAVLRRDNVSEIEAFHRLAAEIGADELTFFEVVPTGRWSEEVGSILSVEDYAALDEFVSAAPPPRTFSVPAAFREVGCFAGRSWMHITPEGDVYPCACLPKVVGNVRKESVKRIWRRMAKLPYGGSKRCPARRFCSEDQHVYIADNHDGPSDQHGTHTDTKGDTNCADKLAKTRGKSRKGRRDR